MNRFKTDSSTTKNRLFAAANRTSTVPPVAQTSGGFDLRAERTIKRASGLGGIFSIITLGGIFALIYLPMAQAIPRMQEHAQLSSQIEQLKDIATAEELYFSDNQTYTDHLPARYFNDASVLSAAHITIEPDQVHFTVSLNHEEPQGALERANILTENGSPCSKCTHLEYDPTQGIVGY